MHEEIWLQVARAAESSNCEKRHVGCLITTNTGALVSGGFNFHTNGTCDCGVKGQSTAEHAETMAIKNIPKYILDSGYPLYAYVDHKPCDTCISELKKVCADIIVNPTSEKKVGTWNEQSTEAVDEEISKELHATLMERESTHGSFEESAVLVQDMKDRMRQTDNWYAMAENKREALDMIVHKIGRILHGDYNHSDHWHDIGGYAKLIEDEL